MSASSSKIAIPNHVMFDNQQPAQTSPEIDLVKSFNTGAGMPDGFGPSNDVATKTFRPNILEKRRRRWSRMNNRL